MDGLALPAAGSVDATDGGQGLHGLSLCAGAGGLDLGLHIAVPGYRTVGYVERDAYAAATLVARMEDAALDRAPVWDDVATFDGGAWRGIVDIVHGGYPCQPFSVAGRKLGDKDPRHLWPHIARIVDEIRPPLCFFENVGGHLRLRFEQVHDDLRSMGYRVKAGLFTAEEVGAPHRRERLFILAYAERAERRTRESARHVANRHDAGRQEASDRAGASGGESMADASRQSQQRPPDQADAFATERRTRPQSGDGRGANVMADAALLLRQALQRSEPDGDDASLGDADGARLEGRHADRQQDGDAEQPFPPGPSDRAGWQRVLERAPHLEPSVCRGADGLATKLDYRVDRLRLCGNGVVPLVAAYALRTLAADATNDDNGI